MFYFQPLQKGMEVKHLIGKVNTIVLKTTILKKERNYLRERIKSLFKRFLYGEQENQGTCVAEQG